MSKKEAENSEATVKPCSMCMSEPSTPCCRAAKRMDDMVVAAHKRIEELEAVLKRETKAADDYARAAANLESQLDLAEQDRSEWEGRAIKAESQLRERDARLKASEEREANWAGLAQKILNVLRSPIASKNGTDDLEYEIDEALQKHQTSKGE